MLIAPFHQDPKQQSRDYGLVKPWVLRAQLAAGSEGCTFLSGGTTIDTDTASRLDGRHPGAVNALLDAGMNALQGGGRAAPRGGLLSFNALPLPPVPLCDETLQVMGPDAEPSVPQPCALCPAGCRSDADLNRHIDEVHGGKDRYRRRWIYEVMHRRPDGVHSGDIGPLDGDGLPDADEHPAVRRLYEAELSKYGVIWRSEEARAQAAQVASAQCVRWRADAFSVDERLRVSSRDPPLRGTEYLGDEVRSVDELRIGLGVWFFGIEEEGVGDPVPATIIDLATGGLPLMERREDGQAQFVKTPIKLRLP
eukprot:gene12481-7539_t